MLPTRVRTSCQWKPLNLGQPSLTRYRYYFSSLGALTDFSDELVEFAFERQIMCDVSLRMYYYKCLQVIAESRDTERLQMKVAMLASQDLVSRRDLAAAYRRLHKLTTGLVLSRRHVLTAIDDGGRLLIRDGMRSCGSSVERCLGPVVTMVVWIPRIMM